jgi:hypothetical protein
VDKGVWRLQGLVEIRRERLSGKAESGEKPECMGIHEDFEPLSNAAALDK